MVVQSATRTQTTLAATVAGARHVPVGWTVLVECVSRKRDALRDSADGTRLEGRDLRGHGWQPWRGARLREDQDGSTGKFLADTRAVELTAGALRSHASQVTCHGVRPRISTRASAR